MQVEPLTLCTGAVVLGVDLAAPIERETAMEIRDALLRWKVLFFREQRLDPASHVAFARHFGEVTPAHTIRGGIPGHPEVWELNDRAYIDPTAKSRANVVQQNWHADITYAPNPPAISILRAVEVPELGGDTQWVNAAMAYTKLSPPLRDFCDGLRAVHRESLQLENTDLVLSTARDDDPRGLPLSTIHPVVRVHQVTAERVLFVNPRFTKSIEGMTQRESQHLLGLLFEQVTRLDLSVRFRWRGGDVAMWDNRAVVHLEPVDYTEVECTRVMHRVTIVGTVPYGVDGRESTVVKGAAFA
jgi:alpha-ketoglutarate-dependent taurine dioxygenase